MYANEAVGGEKGETRVPFTRVIFRATHEHSPAYVLYEVRRSDQDSVTYCPFFFLFSVSFFPSPPPSFFVPLSIFISFFFHSSRPSLCLSLSPPPSFFAFFPSVFLCFLRRLSRIFQAIIVVVVAVAIFSKETLGKPEKLVGARNYGMGFSEHLDTILNGAELN